MRTVRWGVTVVLACLLVPAAPVLAAQPAPQSVASERCGPGSVELVTGGEAPLVAGDGHVQGYLLRRRVGAGRSCVAPGVLVELLARVKNSADAVVVRRATTDAAGRVQFRVVPPNTVVLGARTLATPEYAAAKAPEAVLRVSTRVSLRSQARGACAVAVTGRTYPAKPGSSVVIRGLGGALGSARVDSDGVYQGVVRRPCGSRVAVTAAIGETHTNAAGASDLPEPADATPRTCGTGETGSGPPGLTHRLELFNTTTTVGGVWEGEQVVANPSSEPVTYQEDQGFSIGPRYRVLRSGTQDVLGTERMTDAGTGPQPVTFAPGAERRTPVRLTATNCDAPVVGFETIPGRPLPPGTVVGRTVVRLGDGNGWASDRVALRIEARR